MPALFPPRVKAHDVAVARYMDRSRAQVPVHVMNQLSTMEHAQFSELGTDWVTLYFRFRDGRIACTYHVKLSDGPGAYIAEAWEYAKAKGFDPERLTLCHE